MSMLRNHSPLGPVQSPSGSSSRVCCRYHPDTKPVMDMEAGDMICPLCGLVIGERLVDPGAEWRDFGDQSGPGNSRVGKAEDPLFENGALTTIIGPPTGNVEGLSRYVKCSVEPARERNLRSAFRAIEDAADRIHLPGLIKDTACGIYKDVHDKVTVTGNHKGALGIACLFIACRIEKVPRTFREVCTSTTHSKSLVGKCFKEITKLLNFRDTQTDGEEFEYVERFSGRLHLEREIIKVAAHVAREATDKDMFPSKGPDVVCSAAILVACLAGNVAKIGLKDLVHVSGASRHAIYHGYRAIANRAQELFPPDFQPQVEWADLPKMVLY